MSRFSIRPVSYAEMTASIDLLREHWEEVALNKAVMVLEPDEERYQKLEADGTFFALGAFCDGELAGYSGNFITQHIHYASLCYANNDVLFVAKQHRNSPLGLRLIRETEIEARRRGARMMSWHAKENTPLANILPRMGKRIQDIIFSSELAQSNFKLLARDLPVEAALDELGGNPLWDAFTARQDAPGSAHHDTRCIVLRGPEVFTIDSVFNDMEAVDYVTIEQLPAVAELARAALAKIRPGTLGRVMLAELKPDGHIDRHADEGAYAEHYDRFHVVLMSAEGNTFTNGDETIHMQDGELWQFNHRAEHEVHNNSNAPRIHLIIDARK